MGHEWLEPPRPAEARSPSGECCSTCASSRRGGRCREQGFIAGLGALKVSPPSDTSELGADGMAQRALRSPVDSNRRSAAPARAPDPLGALGRPMPAPLGEELGARFGRDFSTVRVFTDEVAAGAADAVGARSFAVGQNIYFGRGQYAPASPAGRSLLAHELAHTIQQASGSPLIQRKLAGHCAEPYEHVEEQRDALSRAGRIAHTQIQRHFAKTSLIATDANGRARSTVAAARTPTPISHVARCSCGRSVVAGGECAECRARHHGALESVRAVASEPGRRLDRGVREDMEAPFGSDFAEPAAFVRSRIPETGFRRLPNGIGNQGTIAMLSARGIHPSSRSRLQEAHMSRRQTARRTRSSVCPSPAVPVHRRQAPPRDSTDPAPVMGNARTARNSKQEMNTCTYK